MALVEPDRERRREVGYANFLGTTDNVALELKVNGQHAALRIEPAADASFGSVPNLIGGYGGNSVSAGESLAHPSPAAERAGPVVATVPSCASTICLWVTLGR